MLDVLVVGAGPAGSRAARVLAEKGASVVLAEKRTRVGEPVQCAEFIPRLALLDLDVGERARVQTVEAMETYVEGERVEVTPSPGTILDRTVFDAELATQAVAAGARLVVGTRVVGRDGETVYGRLGERRVSWKPRLIIGADGPRSTVASWIDQRQRAVVKSLQERHVLTRPLTNTLVFLDRRFRGGYGWLFPRGSVANVGIGIDQEAEGSLQELLQAFVEELCKAEWLRPESCVGRTGGLIPVSGAVEISGAGNVILAGDAAGATHPITGAGIAPAIATGDRAGKAALAWLENPSEDVLREYDCEWKDLLGLPLRQGVERRKYALGHWDTEHFGTLARKTWVAFPEYYQGIRRRRTRGPDD